MAQTLESAVHSELIIKKSRFLGCVEPTTDRATAQARVAELKQQHPAAAHVCWALMAAGQSAANDDGEPGGTAGLPMLNVMRHHELDGTLATVVRYFGGVKLGSGGLVRAYTDAVAQALLIAKDTGKLKVMQRMVQLQCSLPYALEGWVRREIELQQASLLDVTHGSVVTISVSLPELVAPLFRQRLDDGGQGRLAWIPSGHNVG
jgi:uncharacterized YigZ family protein